jgi:hypothetical protein
MTTAATELPVPSRLDRAGIGYVAQLACVGLAACAVSCLRFCPQFVLWRGLGIGSEPFIEWPELHRAIFALQQLNHPLVRITNPGNIVLQWRLLFPVIGHALYLPPTLYLALPHIGCVVVTAYTAHLMLREGANWLAAFFAATLLATGSWFFVSTGWLGYSDSWYLLGLLAAAFSPWRTTLALTCLLEPFIDERFVLTLPLVYVIRQIHFDRLDRRHLREALIDAGVIAAPTVPYLALRSLALLRSADAGSGHYVQWRMNELKSVPVPWQRWLDGWWEGLRCGWPLVILAVWLQFRRRLPLSAVVLAGVCAVTIAMAMLIAADIGRTNSALWPAALLGLLLLLRWRPRWMRYGLPALLVGNLLLPANNVVTFYSEPVNSFFTELERYRHPTGMISSVAWLELAMEENLRKDTRGELHDLDIAVQLDEGSTQALVNRAIFFFNFNDLDRAITDADAALAIDPKSADALFIRGAIYSRRNDPKDAARLLQAALDNAPPDWLYSAACRALLRH